MAYRSLPFSDEGDCHYFSLCATNAVCRFGVSQGGKLRPCDDFRRNLVNLIADILTSIMLPTWGRISEIARAAYPANREWAFIKGDRASDYKQLLLGHSYANLSDAALRHPDTRKWMDFVPNVLLLVSF